MTPLSSIATIDDLIVALLRLGYKKRYDEWDWSRDGGIIEDYDKEKERNTFCVWKVPSKSLVRVFIHYKTNPIDDVYDVGDVFLTAQVVGKYYPYIKQWFVSEICGGTDWPIAWEDAENINLEQVDQYLNKTIKKWERDSRERLDAK